VSCILILPHETRRYCSANLREAFASVSRQNNEYNQEELIVAQLPKKLFVPFRTAGSLPSAQKPIIGPRRIKPT